MVRTLQTRIPRPRPCIIPGCPEPADLAYTAVTGDHELKITRPGGARIYSCTPHAVEVIQRIAKMLEPTPPDRIRAVPLRAGKDR
jgi:hypothetical protein